MSSYEVIKDIPSDHTWCKKEIPKGTILQVGRFDGMPALYTDEDLFVCDLGSKTEMEYCEVIGE